MHCEIYYYSWSCECFDKVFIPFISGMEKRVFEVFIAARKHIGSEVSVGISHLRRNFSFLISKEFVEQTQYSHPPSLL